MKKKLLALLIILVASVSQTLAVSAPDPSNIATGARPLGMGKAFVGLADDVGSISLNPAGIANPNRWQLTSMSGKLLEDFNYLSVSGIYPTNYGNLGFSYINSSISGALPTTIEVGSNPNNPIYTIDPNQSPMSYYNNLMIISYGTKLERMLGLPLLSELGKRVPWLNDLNFGLNLKLFSVSLTGDHITQGNAHGQEMDLGLQGKPLTWLSLGGNVQNALPASLGGKLHYDSGWEESYPAVLKLGMAANLLGPQNALRALGNHKLKFLTDLDYQIQSSTKIPTLFHLGLEWLPLDLIAIRCGLDQEMTGVGQTTNDFTTGLGLYYKDFRFDVAYHPFAGAPGISNYFFSLSYGITPLVEVEKIVATPDKLITSQLVVAIHGTAVDPEISTIKINGVKMKLSGKSEFNLDFALNVGKNTIKIEGFNDSGRLISTKKLRLLRLINYPDVPKETWAYDAINYIGTLGIIKGYPDGKFKPEGNITRAESAALLIRTKLGGEEKIPTPRVEIFKDVNFRHWAIKYINVASNSGIVKGYPDSTFKPSANISRAEGLAMIARFGGVKELPYAYQYSDVDARYWAAPIISGADKEGLLIHFKGKPLEPNKKLNRAEAVELLYRSKPVMNLINDLKNFEKY